MKLAERPRIRIPMRSLIFFSLPNPSSMFLGLTQHLAEMSTRNLPEKVKLGRRVRLSILLPSVNTLTTKCGILDVIQHYRLPLPVMGIRLDYFRYILGGEHAVA
jgi:hypothetical protein